MIDTLAHVARRAMPLLFGIAAGMAAWCGTALPAHAQSGTVAGTVVDAKSGLPLPDVIVHALGTDLRATTGVRGEFRIVGPSGPSVRIEARRIGYQLVTVDAAVGGRPVRIEMTESAIKLDQVVITGTGAADQQKRSLGNAIGELSIANTLAQSGPPAKIQNLLSAVPGVRVMLASGSIGSGGTTRIRGSGSLSLSNEPLIYVDGIRVNNQAATTSLGFSGAQESPSRINDINPEEIESIEVLKGPSAATIYGTEASNGVMQIITKRGRAGRPTFELHTGAGANWIDNPEGRYPSNYYVGRTDGLIHEFNVQRFNRQRGYPAIFRTGVPQATGASLSGGIEQLRYFFSVDYNHDEGPVTYNWQNKYNGRANLSYANPDGKFKVDLSLGALRSRLRSASGAQPITTSILWACDFPWCEPSGPDTTKTGWNGKGHGFQFYRPEDYLGVFGLDEVDRTTFSVTLTHHPFPWLQQRLAVGPDYTNNKSSRLIDRDGTGYNPFFGNSAEGNKTSQQVLSTFLTIDYGASAVWTASKDVEATSSVGAQYYDKQFETLFASGAVFPIPGPSDVTGGARRDASESFLDNKTFGVYGQEQLAWKNRLFVTAALRADNNSAFGKNFKAVYYPKFSLSWVLSEEPWMTKESFVSQLRVRGAWGRAGLQPDVFSTIQTYQPVLGTSGSSVVSPQNIGNPNLKPEIGEETEIGFDAGLFGQRLGLEFTYYNKDVKDAILSVPNRPSRGFPGSTFLNIGKTRNRGYEVGVNATAFNTRSWGLDLRGTLATNDSKIVDMGGTASAFVGSSFIQQWNVQGYAPSSYFYKRVVSSTLTTQKVGVYTLPLATNPMCEGGTDLGNGDGSTVPCASAPRLYRGRPTPSWNGSASATLRIGERLRLFTLVDFLGGGTAVVGDVGAQHTFFRNSYASLIGDPILEGYRLDPNGPGATGLFNTGFAKLRTVSVTYDLPPMLLRRLGTTRSSITISGENLAFLWRAQPTSFGAKWIDPELLPNRSSDTTGNFTYTQESWPQLARIRATVRLTY